MKDTLLDELTRLTCHFCDGAAIEESVRIQMSNNMLKINCFHLIANR